MTTGSNALSGTTHIILDGSRPGDDFSAHLSALTRTLEDEGARVRLFPLRELKLGLCIGCFDCWLKTPGQCVHKDAGADLAAAILGSQVTIFFGPLVFGGYSPELKGAVDRCFSSLLQPYLKVVRGETHHVPRYGRYPRLVGVGIQPEPNGAEAALFRVTVGRNALNLHAPSYAAEVFPAEVDPQVFDDQFRSLLAREDKPPLKSELAAILPTVAEPGPRRMDGVPHALLLTGSPKVKTGSTSAALGAYMIEQLQRQGWETETFPLRPNLRHEAGQARLCQAADRADLILLSFPLYNDSLPELVIRALAAIHAHRQTFEPARPQRLAVVCNNGFPEAHQNIPALAVVAQFARQSGIEWAGGLMMGAGEAISGGQLLGTIRRRAPSVTHVTEALQLAAEALANGAPVPPAAVKMIAATPIPLMPFPIWRTVFIAKAAQRWEREANDNGVGREALRSQPLQGKAQAEI